MSYCHLGEGYKEISRRNRHVTLTKLTYACISESSFALCKPDISSRNV